MKGIRKMFSSKKDVNYFDLFNEAAALCKLSAEMLEDMLESDASLFYDKMMDIHKIEHQADELYHKLYRNLNISFITPIEREDILEIARFIEQTIDAIDDVAIMIDMLRIDNIRPEAKEMIKLIVKSCSVLVLSCQEFKNFKKSKELTKHLVDINHVEEEGDQLYQRAIKNLFENEPDVREIIKWKNIFETMEDVLDACESVADIMETVIVKNS